MKCDRRVDRGSIVWAYFRDSGSKVQKHGVGQQIDVAREYAAKHDYPRR